MAIETETTKKVGFPHGAAGMEVPTSIDFSKNKRLLKTISRIDKAYKDLHTDEERVRRVKQSMDRYLIRSDRVIVSKEIAKNSPAINRKKQAMREEYGLGIENDDNP